MALPVSHKLFIEPTLGVAYASFSGSTQVSNPSFFLGDKAQLEIYLVKDTGLATFPRQEADYSGLSFKVAVGQIDESPTGGTWLLSYGGNTTSALAYNATAAQVQAALNALASITSAGGVTVTKVGDNYNVLFNQDGARTELTADAASLTPLSTAGISTLQEGTVSQPAIYLVHLQRTVAAYATSFTQVSASAASVSALSAWDGGRATYRVSISPDPKGGTFTLAFDAQTGTDVTTSAISVGASALDVQNALNRDALLNKVTVQQVGAFAWDVTVTTQPGTNGLTVSGAGLLSFSGFKGELNLNTASAISLLDGADFIQTTLEVEITSDSKPLTVLQIPCLLKSAVVDEAAVEPLVLDTYLSQSTADGRYYRLSNNLSEGTASTIRTNLDVYSTSQVDTALALKANSSHTHIIGDVTGLQTALDGKAAASHSHSISDVTNLQTSLDAKASLAGAAFTGNVTVSTQVGIGGVVAVNPANKLAIHSGNIVFTSGFGLAFGDGTTQTTAALPLTGGTLTGRVVFPNRTAGQIAHLNLGTVADNLTVPTTLVEGDIFFHDTDATGGYNVRLAYTAKSFSGTLTNYSLAVLQNQNFFTQPQTISCSHNSQAALRVTQLGTGEAIRVEDSTNPDGTAFVVDNVGNASFGGTVSLSNGSLVISGNSNYGIQIGTGNPLVTQLNTQGNPNTNNNFGYVDYPYEITMTIGGLNYAMPARLV